MSDHHGEQHEVAPTAGATPRPRSEPRSLRYHDLAGARPLPVGKVLAIGALALLMAALLNADGLFELANRQPVGWKRDVATGAVAPFCTVGRVSRLKDIRTQIRRAADKEVQSCHDRPVGSDAFVAPPTTTTPAGSPVGAPGSPVTPESPPATRPRPTAEDPLRLWLGGDSMTIELAQAMEEMATARPELALTTHPQVSSGLTRPDYFDWPAYLATEVLPARPQVMVVMFGANDSQGMELAEGPAQPDSDEWQAEYRRRVGVVMDQLREEERLVVWVGQPHMRSAGFDGRMSVLNDIYASEAEGRPWVRFFDSRPVLSPAGQGFQASDGDDSLRQGDGIHLDRAGSARLAAAVLEVVEVEVLAPAPPR